jgi:hypothetical protein
MVFTLLQVPFFCKIYGVISRVDFLLYEQYTMILFFKKNTKLLTSHPNYHNFKNWELTSRDDGAEISLWTFRWSHSHFTSVLVLSAAAAAASSTTASAVIPAVTVVPAVAVFLWGRELTGQPQGRCHRFGCDWHCLGRRLHGRRCTVHKNGLQLKTICWIKNGNLFIPMPP